MRARAAPHFDCLQCANPTVQRLGPKRFILRDHEIRFTDSKGIVWVALPGTQTDGGSIPWIAEPLAGSGIDSPLLPGYILHDRHYQLAPPHETGFFAANQSWERQETDRMLHEVGMAVSLQWWRSRAIYEGVRLGGWRPWQKHATENEETERNTENQWQTMKDETR